MNILILSWRGPKHPNAGGAEISTHEHAKGWVKAGYKVTLFTSAFVNCKPEELIDGVNIIRKGRQFIGVQWEAFKWYLFDNHPKFDLVIDQFHGIPFFTTFFVKSKKLAFIHEITKEIWWFNPWPWPFNKIVAVVGEFIEPYIFKLYKKVPFMTVSQSTHNDLVDWGIESNNITIIHNGVRVCDNTKIKKKEKKKTLIFLGSISKDKGIEYALETFSYINQRNDKWQFWIVGSSDANYLNYLKQKSYKLGIKDNIKFWGIVTEKKKFELLSRAHILINPSIREGWCLVVIEAAFVGTPTVAFDAPGLRDSILNNKTGIICSKNTTVNLAEEIVKLLDNLTKYKRIRLNSINWSKKFSWGKSVLLSTKLVEAV